MCMAHIPDTSAETLFTFLQKELDTLGIPISQCRGRFTVGYIFSVVIENNNQLRKSSPLF